MKADVDIVVVGAGPVGLLAALELALCGVRVVVLERLSAPSLVSKALGIGPLGAEALQRRGMADAMAAAEARGFAAMEQAGSNMRSRGSNSSGHFGGLFLRRDAQTEPDRRMRLVDQQAIEAMLTERARDLGIEVRRGCEVTALDQQTDGVDVAWASPDGMGRLRCAYLVGCDGGRSRVRKLAGFDFPGTSPTLTMYQGVLDVDDPADSLPKGWQRTSHGLFVNGPFPRRMFMLDFSGPPKDRDAPVTHEEFEDVLRRVSGTDVRVKALDSASRWTDNTRLVETYRKGRVLLAGDASHIHSPFGGQGLSLGLVDAQNLGWKLAAVARGDRPESLLDTYTAERRPVAETVLANTLAQTAIMRPDPQSGAMRDIVANLLEIDDVARLVGGMMRGLSSRYDLGSDRDEVGRLIADRPVGCSDRSLYDLMQDGRGVLLDASPGEMASKLVAAVTKTVRCVPVESGASMLIRPDACVAWSADGHGTDGLADAVERWFGGTLGKARAA